MRTTLCLAALSLLCLPAFPQDNEREVELSKPGQVSISPREPKARGGLPLISEDGFMGSRDRNVIVGAWTGHEKNEELLQYGNWYGPGWWGGSKDPKQAGNRLPVDSLDAVAMRHDFAYQLAEQQGKIHGLKEEQRLKAMADAVAVRETLKLDADPAQWPQPSSDPDKASRYRDRIISGFDYTSAMRDGTSTLTTVTDWATSPIINYEMDTSNQLDEEQLSRSVDILQKNWTKSHPAASAEDATVEMQQQQQEEAARRAVAEQKTQAALETADRKRDPTGTQEFSLKSTMTLPEDLRPSPQNKTPQAPITPQAADTPPTTPAEDMRPGAAGGKTTDIANKPAEAEPPDATIPVIPNDCTLSFTSWTPEHPEMKFEETRTILDGKVTGTNTFRIGNEVVVHAIFEGAIKDNVITGRCTSKFEPIHASTPDTEQIIHNTTITEETLTLHMDGTFSNRGPYKHEWRREVLRGKDGGPNQNTQTSTFETTGRWHILTPAEKKAASQARP